MGMITDIQRFSLNDGPGIRTTVFLKGCNMDCAWCHNPETRALRPDILIYKDKCVKCGACVGFDPAKTDALPPARETITAEQAGVCYAGALQVDGRDVTAADIMAEVVQDKDYYANSGGGLTLSGGEVMMQPEFAGEILKLAKRSGIQTAIETNLAYDFERFVNLRGALDLIMADIKLLDSEAHKHWTGIDNAQILHNARMLGTLGIPIILRTPIIPGANDDEAEIGSIAQWIASNIDNVIYYELLNYNPLGQSKYIALALDNPFSAARPLPEETMSRLAKAASQAGIPVRVG